MKCHQVHLTTAAFGPFIEEFVGFENIADFMREAETDENRDRLIESDTTHTELPCEPAQRNSVIVTGSGENNPLGRCRKMAELGSRQYPKKLKATSTAAWSE